MDEKISFERFLFGDGNEIIIDDMEFCVNRIIRLLKIRPHQLEKSVRLSDQYCKFSDFRQILLENSNKCPVLIYQLHKRGVLVFEEIEPFLEYDNTFLFSYYFRNEIKDFDCFIKRKDIPDDLDESFFENENDIDQLSEYGYLQSSIEYCLKYDVVDDLAVFDNLNEAAKWSPFEWSDKPEYLDLLSFAGFFCSIKCFKYLLMKGFEINAQVLSMVVCGGCFDLFHLCKGQQLVTPSLFCRASEFFHLPMLVFMIENGAVINAKGKDNGITLHVAARYGHLSVVEYLVNQKADINAHASGYLSGTPLHLAAQNGHLSVVEYLVNQKADIYSKNKDEWTPLHFAAQNGHLSVVEYLVNQKADINAQASGYRSGTPLHLAAQNGHLSVVEYLVNQKAEINANNSSVEFFFLIGLLFP